MKSSIQAYNFIQVRLMMFLDRYWHTPFRIYIRVQMLFPAILLFVLAIVQLPAVGEEYGPVNLLTTMRTPFSAVEQADQWQASINSNPDEIAIAHVDESLSSRLSARITQPRLYLPGTMVLGEVAEFTIHAKPGKWCALAIADKNAGAKPVLGHTLRLGPDRKVVAITQIPSSGVGTMLVETPIEGDLVGGNLYFEAALWSNTDMSDVEFAQCVASNSAAGQTGSNGVLIAGQPGKTKGIRVIPDTRPLVIKQTSLNSDKPGDQ